MLTHKGATRLGRPKKRSDGRYTKSFSFIDGNGDKKRKSVYGRTLKEVEQKYLEALEEEQKREKARCEPGSEMTVREWANTWLVTYKSNLAYKTIRMYELDVNTYILPVIGHLSLRDVQILHIQKLLNTHVAKGHNRTAKSIYTTIRQIFEIARKNKYITENPTLDVECPKYQKPDKRSLTDEETFAICQASMTLKEKAFVLFLLYTGVRRGEALAMLREDLDMRNGLVRVNKSLYFKPNQPEVGSTKNRGSRVVPILNELKPKLAEYLLSLEGDALFPSAHGVLMSESAFSRFWEKISRKIHNAGVTADDITPHIFRHTFTSNLVKNGVTIKDAQYVLGHKSAKVTLDWYAHFDPKAPENVKSLLNGDSNGSGEHLFSVDKT